MSHSPDTSAVAAVAAVRRGEIRAEDLAARFLDRIRIGNEAVGAVRHVLDDRAVEAARAVEARIRAGERPPLAGLPVVVKENCDVTGAPCSAGLAFRAGHVPARDASVVARLSQAGAVVLGVARSDPGAFGVRTAEVTHPLDAGLTVGGSSGGSAAALAAGFALGAIGTDTGGSVRIPSACCGTAGLKPTYGALPTDGVFPLVRSLDHVGPMARTAADVRLLWAALADRPAPPAAARPRRIGFDPAWVEIADPPIRAAFASAVEALRDEGVAVVEIGLPALDDVVSMHGQIFLAEAAAYHCAHHERDLDGYPAIAREWFAAARDMPVGGYVDACRARVEAAVAVDRLLEAVDSILAPTLCVARPLRSAATVEVDGTAHDFVMGLVRLTCLFNHTGHPVVSFPTPNAPDSLASSLQIVGPRGSETAILGLAASLEASPD